MQQHAMALGYFFLAAFCVFTSTTCDSLSFRFLIAPLWLAAMMAAWAGFMFLLRAFALYPVKIFMKWLLVAQEPPVRQPRSMDEQTA